MNRPSRRPAISRTDAHDGAPDSAPDAAWVADVSHRMRQALADTILHFGENPQGDQPALTVPRAQAPIAPARLAAAHPGGAKQRRQASEMYGRCLARYRDGVRPQDTALGIDDVGAAVAHFVAVNFEALQGVAVTPAMLLCLERQLAGMVQLSPAWSGAKARDRQTYFEQLAILTVYVAELSTRAPSEGPAAVANVRRAARGYLQTLLGLNPDHLTLGASGLALATDTAAASA